MAVKVNKITYPTKCYECFYSGGKLDENLRTNSTCNISIKELCPRTIEGASHHKRLIRLKKRPYSCMINQYAVITMEV